MGETGESLEISHVRVVQLNSPPTIPAAMGLRLLFDTELRISAEFVETISDEGFETCRGRRVNGNRVECVS